MINVAVLGYGTVGSGVVEVIETNKEVIDKKSRRRAACKIYPGFKRFPRGSL